jgi:deoxycytidine triphosphate deaminase
MAEMTDDPAKLPDKTAPSLTEDTQAPPHKVRPWPMIARAVSVTALSVVIYGLTIIIYRMPPAVRTFVALSAVAGGFGRGWTGYADRRHPYRPIQVRCKDRILFRSRGISLRDSGLDSARARYGRRCSRTSGADNQEALMPFLANAKIAELMDRGQLIINGDKKYIQQASYDLRLGDEVYVVGKKIPDKLSKRYPYLNLAPGQFALLTSLETVAIPKEFMGFITMRSHFKFQGLVNISGFHVDPTYTGKLLFAVQNVGPSDIRLKFEDRTFTIFFANVDGDIVKNREGGISGIELDKVQILGGASVTLSQLKKEMDQWKFIVLVYTPIVVAVLGVLIKLFWPSGNGH